MRGARSIACLATLALGAGLIGCGDDGDGAPAATTAAEAPVEDDSPFESGDEEGVEIIDGTLAPVHQRLLDAGFDVRIGTDFDLDFFKRVPDAVSGLVVTELEDDPNLGKVSPPDKFVRIIEYEEAAGAEAFVAAAEREQLTAPYSFIEGTVVYYASALLDDYGEGPPSDAGAAEQFLGRVHDAATAG